MTTRTHPLDPRDTACQGCADCTDPLSSFRLCSGTGRVPLKPEPTVEVYQPNGGKWNWRILTAEKLRIGFNGLYHTEADALRAARLAWLGVTLEGPDEDGEWTIENVCGFGTADQAIEAAFAARDGEGRR